MKRVRQLTYIVRAIRNSDETTDADRAADGGWGLVLLGRMVKGPCVDDLRDAQ